MTEPTEKRCIRCDTVKPIGDFYERPERKSPAARRTNTCKECLKDRARQRYRNGYSEVLSKRRRRIRLLEEHFANPGRPMCRELEEMVEEWEPINPKVVAVMTKRLEINARREKARKRRLARDPRVAPMTFAQTSVR